MTDKEAIEVLTALLEKGVLNDAEKDAIRTAVGFLALANKTAENHIEKLKKKRDDALT